MYLTELFNHISYGELANFYIGNTSEGVIRQEDYPKIINNINIALIEIYKQVPLRYEQVIIQQYSHILDYKLDKRYSYAANGYNADLPNGQKAYIMDSVNRPFLDNVINVVSVHSEIGQELPLNDSNNPNSINTPTPDVIQIPYPVDTNVVFVVYRAHPPKLNSNIANISGVEVDIPAVVVEPLLAYLGYRAYINNTNKQESIAYFNRFNTLIAGIQNAGVMSETPVNTRFKDNLWV